MVRPALAPLSVAKACLASACIAALSLAACAAPPPSTPAQSLAPSAAKAPTEPQGQLIARGKQLAEMMCASCHAIGASGDSPAAEAPPFRTLSQLYPIEQLEEAMAEGILTGHPMMPNFQFTEGQIDALTAYLRSIQARGAS